MDAILSRLPTSDSIKDWAYVRRGKLLGLLAGTIGVLFIKTFLMVAITGVPIQGERLDPDRETVYPNL